MSTIKNKAFTHIHSSRLFSSYNDASLTSCIVSSTQNYSIVPVVFPFKAKRVAYITPTNSKRTTHVLQRYTRCHLFKGQALAQWFNLGKCSNPVTRTTVLSSDWCRLTYEQPT